MPTRVGIGDESGKLYVFLHGLISLIDVKDETQDGFFGLVIDMGDAHSYRGGDWLTELPLPANSILELQGVTPGKGTIDRSKVTVVPTPSLFPLPQLYATLRFPRPESVRSLLRVTIPSAEISGKGLTAVKKKPGAGFTVASLQILEYKYKKAGDVALRAPGEGKRFWGPAIPTKKKVATLHFFAEPERDVAPRHGKDEFLASCRLFPGFDVSLKKAQVLNRTTPEPGEFPSDVNVNEHLGLLDRREMLEEVAAFLKGDGTFDPGTAFSGSRGVLCSAVPGGIPK